MHAECADRLVLVCLAYSLHKARTAAACFKKLPHVFDIQAVTGGAGGIAHAPRKAKFARRIMSLNRLTHKVMQLLRQFALPLSDVTLWKAATNLLKLMGFRLQYKEG